MNLKKLLIVFVCLISSLGITAAQIQPGKGIKISIAGVPDAEKVQITGNYPVAENGTINMPYIGIVRAAGLRSQQLAINLQQQYRSAGIFRDPTIQVITDAENVDVNQETVTIGGQVRKSGPVPFNNELTLWQAIQNAGGPTEFGTMRRVRLTRAGKSKEYNLNNAQFKDIRLQRNDAIEVPQKRPFEGN
jgi:protein involved in polysaccharide export with SLBB domain